MAAWMTWPAHGPCAVAIVGTGGYCTGNAMILMRRIVITIATTMTDTVSAGIHHFRRFAMLLCIALPLPDFPDRLLGHAMSFRPCRSMLCSSSPELNYM